METDKKCIYVLYVNTETRSQEQAIRFVNQFRLNFEETQPTDKLFIIASDQDDITCINPVFLKEEEEYEKILNTLEKLTQILNKHKSNE